MLGRAAEFPENLCVLSYLYETGSVSWHLMMKFKAGVQKPPDIISVSTGLKANTERKSMTTWIASQVEESVSTRYRSGAGVCHWPSRSHMRHAPLRHQSGPLLTVDEPSWTRGHQPEATVTLQLPDGFPPSRLD